MTTATVRDLRYRFADLQARLRQGETIQILNRKEVVGTLVPPARKAADAPSSLQDLGAFRKALWGKRKPSLTGTQLVRQDRDRGF